MLGEKISAYFFPKIFIIVIGPGLYENGTNILRMLGKMGIEKTYQHVTKSTEENKKHRHQKS